MAQKINLKKILIINDDMDWLEANKIILEAHSYQVYTAYNSEDGMVKFFEVLPDIVIIDVATELQNELLYLCRRIRSYPKIGSIPIIIVNGIHQLPRFQFSPETNKKYLQVNELIDKPVDPSNLVQLVDKWLLG